MVRTFLKGISPKVKVKAQREFKLTYYEITIQHVSRYTANMIDLSESIKYLLIFKSKTKGKKSKLFASDAVLQTSTLW